MLAREQHTADGQARKCASRRKMPRGKPAGRISRIAMIGILHDPAVLTLWGEGGNALIQKAERGRPDGQGPKRTSRGPPAEQSVLIPEERQPRQDAPEDQNFRFLPAFASSLSMNASRKGCGEDRHPTPAPNPPDT
jgi:hypothetical protein